MPRLGAAARRLLCLLGSLLFCGLLFLCHSGSDFCSSASIDLVWRICVIHLRTRIVRCLGVSIARAYVRYNAHSDFFVDNFFIARCKKIFLSQRIPTMRAVHDTHFRFYRECEFVVCTLLYIARECAHVARSGAALHHDNQWLSFICAYMFHC